MHPAKKAAKRPLQKKAGAKRGAFRFPRELKKATHEKMFAFVKGLSDAHLEQILRHYNLVEKRMTFKNSKELPKKYPALENLAQYAAAEKMVRGMKKKPVGK